MGTQFRLKETRLKYGKKQPEVAAVLGIGVPAYSMMESGQREINGSKLIKLARYYECSVDELLGTGPWDTGERKEQHMGMFNKSAAKKMASDADEFIVSDGKVHALVFQVAGKAMYSTATQLEDKVTERIDGTLSRIQDKGCQVVDVKMAVSANTRDSDMMLYSFTVLYR